MERTKTFGSADQPQSPEQLLNTLRNVDPPGPRMSVGSERTIDDPSAPPQHRAGGELFVHKGAVPGCRSPSCFVRVFSHVRPGSSRTLAEISSTESTRDDGWIRYRGCDAPTCTAGCGYLREAHLLDVGRYPVPAFTPAAAVISIEAGILG